MIKKLHFHLGLCLLACLVWAGCSNPFQSFKTKNDTNESLASIIKKGKIVAVVDCNSTDYFIYKGVPMGFQFELLQKFADYIGVRLEIKTANTVNAAFSMLNHKQCDILAKDLGITTQYASKAAFSFPHSQARQVLVQRKPANWAKMKPAELDEKMVRNQLELAGKTVFVPKNSMYKSRLVNLSEEIGDSIHTVEVTKLTTEELIQLVSNGKIEFTVCDENVAFVNQKYFDNIDIQTAISFPQNKAWAVRRADKELLTEINNWLVKYKATHQFQLLYKKYFQNPKSTEMVNSQLYAPKNGKISIYDDLIKLESKKIGWDWRLLASMICTESRFAPKARSTSGAIGLMQLKAEAFKHLNMKPSVSPQQNIIAGVQYIKWLDDLFKPDVKDVNERIKFVLAAYNIGHGHVTDARKLAEKYGKNPNRWDNQVEYFLLHKTLAQYYKDPLAEHGFCKGYIPCFYVEEIMDRYGYYKEARL